MAPYIGQALDSALSQTWAPLEVIVVDDGSSDGTRSRVQEVRDARVRLLVNERNRGPSYSRNRAISAASGDWIALLDGDDWWHPHRLTVLLDLACATEADIVGDDLHMLQDGCDQPWTTLFRARKLPAVDPFRVDTLFLIEHSLCVRPLVSNRFLRRTGILYEEQLRHGEDFVFCVECLMAGARCVVTPEPMYYYRTSRAGAATTRGVAGLQASVEGTLTLINRPAYQNDPKVLQALQDRLRRYRDALAYLEVVEPLKQLRIGEAAKRLLANPRWPLLAAQRLPQNLGNRWRIYRAGWRNMLARKRSG